MEGWIKLHRSILDSKQFADPTRLKVWIWMLCKAAIVRRTLTVKTGNGCHVLVLEPGQFVFGRNKAEQELHIDESAVYRIVQGFVSDGCISIKSNNQYSVITISQWSEFQDERGFYDFEIIEDRTTDEQESNGNRTTVERDSNEIRTHNKKVNKVNNVEKVKKEQPVFFRETPFLDFDLFKMEFFGIQKYESLDLSEYYENLLNWSNSNGEKKMDWIATAKNWMNRDLKTQKNNTNGNATIRPSFTGAGGKHAGREAILANIKNRNAGRTSDFGG